MQTHAYELKYIGLLFDHRPENLVFTLVGHWVWSEILKMKQLASAAPSAIRLDTIARARQVAMLDRRALPAGWVAPWVERSWQRCLHLGLAPQQPVVFDTVTHQQMQRTADANQRLVQTAKPILEKLGRAIVNTRYFAILTNRDGVVVDTSGAIDRSDPRADLITRIGTDLSERSVGTTAIGAALNELQPVWLHRGEHFFSNTGVYSCAGAPLWGPDGACVGMLDLTGIDAVERPELKHLVTQTASHIENALVLAQPHTLMVRLNWPGNPLGTDADGIVCLDADGWITAANPTARQMVPQLATPGQTLAHSQHPVAVHVSEVFGIGFELLFDAALGSDPVLEIPLWTGLRLQALAMRRADECHDLHGAARALPSDSRPLNDIKTALIRRAVEQAKGNVAKAAQALGISRATVYRKLGNRSGEDH
jgi:transcriptional regulator of acetoin/glycerol metabolism